MTYELRITSGLKNVTRNVDYQQSNIEVTTTLEERASGDLSVTTGGVSVDTSTILTGCGWARFQNLDSTNFVLVGSENVAYFLRLDPDAPGQVVRLVPANTTIYFKADTATCIVAYTIWGN